MKKLKVFTSLILLMSFFSAGVYAEKLTVKDWLKKSESWHFYNERTEEEKKAIEDVAKEYAVYMGKSEHEPMSSAWIKENLPDFRRTAADNPTATNVLAMMYMEKMLRDRGKALGVAAKRYAQLDPYLDASHKSSSTSKRSLYDRKKFYERKFEVANQLLGSKKIGLWIFYNSQKCDLCEPAYRLFDKFIKENGTPAILVATDGKAPVSKYLKDLPVKYDDKMVKKYNITEFPTIFAYNLESKEFVQIARGMVTKETFVDRLISAASFSGWIDQDTQNYASIIYDPYSFTELKFNELGDNNKKLTPSDIVKHVKSGMESIMNKESQND